MKRIFRIIIDFLNRTIDKEAQRVFQFNREIFEGQKSKGGGKLRR